MGTSLSWPGMHEGQVEVGSRAPSPLPPSLRSRAGDEEPQGMRDHFVLSIPPPPLAWSLAPPRTAENGKGCV